ncbi:hypothetical protein NCCP436_27680 [Pseudomonas sp. NCCP-436]|nr:hypothetical protein NCCP436_27680 [Pseudomonas sp. NCCP-436]
MLAIIYSKVCVLSIGVCHRPDSPGHAMGPASELSAGLRRTEADLARENRRVRTQTELTRCK